MGPKEVIDAQRGMIRRVTLSNIKDTGETQTATVEVAEGITREEVEVMQPYGFASHPPEDGSLAIALALGGDQGDMVILPIGSPAKRMGKLDAKDVGIYNADGDKIVLGAGGAMRLLSGASILIQVGGTFFKIADGSVTQTVGGVSYTMDAAGHHFSGGGIWHDGVPIDKTHVHGGVVRGGSDTEGPH